MKLNLYPTETIHEVVNRYPLSVEYFIETGYSGDSWDTDLTDYVRDRNISLNRLEQDLREHLRSAVQPEAEDCEAISCDPLPFCPDDLSFTPMVVFFRLLEHCLQWLRRNVILPSPGLIVRLL